MEVYQSAGEVISEALCILCLGGVVGAMFIYGLLCVFGWVETPEDRRKRERLDRYVKKPERTVSFNVKALTHIPEAKVVQTPDPDYSPQGVPYAEMDSWNGQS